MSSYEGISRNFRLLLVQVSKQLEHTRELLRDPQKHLVAAIHRSEDYIDTQRAMIENDCFAFIRQSAPDQQKQTVDSVRALNVVTANLERIADFSVNIAAQLEHLSDNEALNRFDTAAYLDRLLRGIGLIADALFERDSSLAMRICQTEHELDLLYEGDLGRIIDGLRNTREVDNLVTMMFILHYLERMGDALLNIGEAILFAVMGERLKVHQLDVLDDAIAAASGPRKPITDTKVDSIWGTRSGLRIGKLEQSPEAGPARRVLFKEGNPDKLNREKDALQRWEEVAPGLVPSVVEYQRKDHGAALLLQYLDGRTFQDILLNGDRKSIRHVRQRVESTLRSLWERTKRDGPIDAGFLQQLKDRIGDVYRLHPDLRGHEVEIGRLRVPSFSEQLDSALAAELKIPAPFSVFIHGDLNIDNIIYNEETDTLHFIDVHRSKEFDYVQDASVFLVSLFRLPALITETRQALNEAAVRFFDFCCTLAADHGDATFQARLALGLIRSFTSSTRFEPDHDFARVMHDRARLLLDQILEHRPAPWESFRLTDHVLTN